VGLESRAAGHGKNRLFCSFSFPFPYPCVNLLVTGQQGVSLLGVSMVYIENRRVSENDGKAGSRGGMRGEDAKWPSVGKREVGGKQGIIRSKGEDGRKNVD